MNTETRILEAAAALLVESPAGDISIRAVCEAAQVGAPTLYRLFEDKDALLAAVVDHGFEQYLASKRAAVPSEDPVRDLRDGWDSHVAFALAQPACYKLMYSPALAGRPEAAREAHRMLTSVIERIAVAGRLSVPVDRAAQMVMAANVGLALSLLYRPEVNQDPVLSDSMREAVIAAITTRAAAPDTAPSPATTLRTRLQQTPPPGFTPVEAALLHEWLGRLEKPTS
ncbi:TetR/AcrR family transcriptional regulator [Streptomyces cinnabarinus]|uniref:TetR/AcrR family transcriptional regulator n=1 Tax=Streptomyces cinnabarinus TaxID=67287 RepID=A0ABY7K3X2_9ACTN|nr:TetR/AcrR family transcriptional regulator [Streptomyces cinnabarinus]WAZ19186.1 TetR/AcrR family transcriptional regulator [Streptomyces cinnabarinus]